MTHEGVSEATWLRGMQRAACIAELTFSVTHKLNNALAGTISNLELAAMEEQLPTRVRDSIKRAQTTAWQAADLNRAFVEFIVRRDGPPGLLDVDGLLAEVVEFFRRLSDRRVEVTHKPSAVRTYAHTQSAALWDSVLGACLLGQRLLPHGGSIQLSAEPAGKGSSVRIILVAPAPPNPAEFTTRGSPDSIRLLEWIVESLAAGCGGRLETQRDELGTTGFLLRLPGTEQPPA